MTKRAFPVYLGLLSLVFIAFSLTNAQEPPRENETIKVALRAVGHQLLLANKDSTSIVLPIKQVDENTFTIAFKEELSLLPNDLVSQMATFLERAAIDDDYRVSVLQCKDKAVAYSFEIRKEVEKTIIPCSGRDLPENCYIIEVAFLKPAKPLSKRPAVWFIALLSLVSLLALLGKRLVKPTQKKEQQGNYVSIGSFKFYATQNKLVKEAEEISLSKKEAELLSIFIAKPNQVITRDELTKKVWEDNGVIVGRSLDTFISKLRKKLKADSSIKIANVHGVGYKLEMKA